MSVLYFGYNEIGAVGLEYLLEQNEEIRAVITHRDDPAEERWFRSVADLARSASIPVRTDGPEGLESLASAAAPDFILSFYFRRMIPMSVLRHARTAALNLHGSLLPRYRGRSPINWVLVNGEAETGITLHHMTRRADAGDIVAQRRIAIAPEETALTLARKCAAETRALLEETWPRLREGRVPRIPQDESRATRMRGRTPDDGRIDWNQSAHRVDCLVRAVTAPWPGAFTCHEGKKIRIWKGRPVGGDGQPGEVVGRDVVAAGAGAYRVLEGDPLPDPGTILGG